MTTEARTYQPVSTCRWDVVHVYYGRDACGTERLYVRGGATLHVWRNCKSKLPPYIVPSDCVGGAGAFAAAMHALRPTGRA